MANVYPPHSGSSLVQVFVTRMPKKRLVIKIDRGIFFWRRLKSLLPAGRGPYKA